MSPRPPRPLTSVLEEVRGTWPGAAWEWDKRFHCALATVGKAQEAAAREAIGAALPDLWTPQTLAESPDWVQQVCRQTGGLRGSQLVFGGEWEDGTVAFCLWWPWGNGNNFSARLGAFAGDDTPLAPTLKEKLAVKS